MKGKRSSGLRRTSDTEDKAMTTQNWSNKLYFGDNLDILRQHVADESVDLISLAPQFELQAICHRAHRQRHGHSEQERKKP